MKCLLRISNFGKPSHCQVHTDVTNSCNSAVSRGTAVTGCTIDDSVFDSRQGHVLSVSPLPDRLGDRPILVPENAFHRPESEADLTPLSAGETTRTNACRQICIHPVRLYGAVFNKDSDVILISIKVWHLPGVGSELLQQQLPLCKKVFATTCDVACGTGECVNDRRDIP